jgi:hypothetical protein
MKYLIQTVETYRVDKEDEAKRMIEEAKSDNHFILKKYSSEYKEKKQKGEVVDTYYKVTLTKAFTDEKEPEFRTEISYANDIESAF